MSIKDAQRECEEEFFWKKFTLNDENDMMARLLYMPYRALMNEFANEDFVYHWYYPASFAIINVIMLSILSVIYYNLDNAKNSCFSNLKAVLTYDFVITFVCLLLCIKCIWQSASKIFDLTMFSLLFSEIIVHACANYFYEIHECT